MWQKKKWPVLLVPPALLAAYAVEDTNDLDDEALGQTVALA